MSIQTNTTEADQLRRKAEIIRDETNEAANTAHRVGQLLIDIVDNCNIDINTLDKRYLRKDKNDEGAGFYTWKAGWMTEAPVRSAVHNIGWEVEKPEGWYVSETGDAWYSSLNVRGPVLSNNIFGSPYYASGWTGFGSQWDMQKAFLETDYGSFRREIRAKMFVIDQIRGTNGSLAVADCNKIDHVDDMGTFWRCYIDTYGGDVWMNMRADDVVMCQRVSKYYLSQIIRVSATYFDLSKNNLAGTGVPEAGDDVIRWDNLSDADRKGLIYLTSSDSYNPYMDVRYGDWNATQGVIKVRNGRLDGINDPAFPELYRARNNFGLYTCNFYGTGELILRSTGESVSRTFEVLKDQMNVGFSEIRYEMQVSKDSVLVNPIFDNGLESWEATNVFYLWTINGSLLQAANRPFMNFVSGAILVNDTQNNRTVLQVSDTTVTQRNAMFTDKESGDYALSFSYRSLMPFGNLEIGIVGSDLHLTLPLSNDPAWKRTEIAGKWDGTGDFIIRVSGGVVNITDISFTSDRITNAINKVKVEYDTKLSIKADEAVLSSFRDEYDEFNRVVRRDYATQSWTATKINTEVGTIVDGKLTNYSTISQTSQSINNAIYNLDLGQYATTSWTSDQITSSVGNLASVSYVNQTANGLDVRISNLNTSVNGAKDITDAFYKFDYSSMMSNRRIEVGAGQPGSYQCQAGLSPNVDNVAFWAGGRYWNAQNQTSAVLVRHDGSGYLASKNIQWTTTGDATIRGRIESNASGNRIIIDPSSRAILMYNSAGKLVGKYSFYEYGSESSALVELFTYKNGIQDGSTRMFGGDIAVTGRDGYDIFRISQNEGGSQLNFYINPSKLPTSTPYYGYVYNENNYLRIKT